MNLDLHRRHSVSQPWAAGRLLRGIAATAALLALLIGVPAALVAFTEWPITGIPTWQQIKDLPTGAASDGAIIGVFIVGLWAAWAVFTISVALEVAAEIRGRDALRLPGAGALQATARNLVATIAMTLGSVGGFSHLTPAGAGTPTVAVSADPISYTATAPGIHVGLADAAAATPPPTAQPEAGSWATVAVVRGDTAWGIADKHYGDGADAHQLWLDNRDQPQPNGQRWANEEDPIQPGWVLRVRTTAPVADTAAVAPGTVTVTPGDHFWGIARDQLAAAWGRPPADTEIEPYWRQLVEANRARLQPPGDPNLIRPGEVFDVPAPPRDPTAAQPAPAPVPPRPAPATPGPEEAPPATPAPDNETAPPAAPTSSPTTTSTPSTTSTSTSTPTTTSTSTTSTTPAAAVPVPGSPASDPGPDRDQAPSDDVDDRDTGWPAGLAPITATGVLATLTLAALYRKRRARRRAARPGAIAAPRPAEDVQTERALAVTSGDVADQLHRLNDAMTAALAALPSAPMVTGVVLHHDGDIEVHVNEAFDPPAPFTPEADGSIWLLAAEDTNLTPANDPVPVLETLVALGQSPAGDWVLVDLESLGTLWIAGDPAAGERLARSLVTELALHPVAHVLSITVIGLDAPEHSEHGITVVDALDEALARDTVLAATETTRHMRRMGLATTLAGRVQGLPRDGLMANVVVVGPGADPNRLERVANAAVMGGMGLALVAVNPDDPLSEEATRIDVDVDGTIQIPHLGITARAASLEVEDLHRLDELLRREPETVPDVEDAPLPVRVVDPDPVEDYAAPSWTHCVRFFADHEVRTPDDRVISFREDDNPQVNSRNTRRGPELLAFMSLCPTRSATFDQISDALWYSRSIASGTVEKLIIGTRRVVGTDNLSLAMGTPAKRYQLGPDVVTDVELLEHALHYAQDVAGADPTAAIEALGGHLGWVIAPPFRSGELGKGLTEWALANRVIDQLEQPLLTAAFLFADLAAEQGPEGLRQALWGIDQALLACPTNEALIRRAMSLDQRLGSIDRADHRYQALSIQLARDEMEPEEETTAAWIEITSRRSRTG